MGRRKGEMTSNVLDRLYPHQIAMPEDECAGVKRPEVQAFADTLSVALRGHAFVQNKEWHRVFCFAKREDAELFKNRFGGEWFDPARRGRGGSWHLLREPKKRHMPPKSGH